MIACITITSLPTEWNEIEINIYFMTQSKKSYILHGERKITNKQLN